MVSKLWLELSNRICKDCPRIDECEVAEVDCNAFKVLMEQERGREST